MKKREIRQHYCRFVEAKHRPPEKLKKFLKFSGIAKVDFKNKYKDLCEVEADIWRSSFKDLLKTLNNSADFAVYTNRERGLAMMFAWFEFMEENRLFFKSCIKHRPWEAFTCGILNDFKKESEKFVKKIIRQGSVCDEFKNREFLNKHMAKIFWPLFLQNIKQWTGKGKKRKNEEWMDALIEKSMTFFFDSLAPNLFDSLFDFLKHANSKK